ncbi:MAG: hypothetical protein HY898_15220 [Deltaproteobacteria bacterium]|nr:hypothetical protein [Deltaproteobacteria bacterium]
MMWRRGSFLILLVAAALIGGCEDKKAKCDKLALSIRGAAKKEMPVAGDLPDPKATPGETDISRALRRSSAAISREYDDWMLKRPDKMTSPKGATSIKQYSEALLAMEIKDEALKGHVKTYSDAVKAVWEQSKERVDADAKAKEEAAIAAVEATHASIVGWCTQ